MRRAGMLLVLLAGGVVASGEYRIWFTRAWEDNREGLTKGFNPDGTPWLIDNPSQAITSDDSPPPPNYTNNLDVYGGHYAVVNFPTYDPSQTPANPLHVNVGDWVYVWGQFYNEAPGARVDFANLRIVHAGGGLAAPEEVNAFWYMVDDMGGLVVKRWDGRSTEADNYATFRNRDQLLLKVAANGLRNLGGTSELWNLYSGGPQDGLSGRIHLLGAIQCLANAGGANSTYTIEIGTDTGGVPQFAINGAHVWPTIGAFEFHSLSGACCIDYAYCVDAIEEECIYGVHGVWRGPGTSCATTECMEGVCCDPVYGCMIEHIAICDLWGGTWLGPYLSCDPSDICTLPLGACCYPDGYCAEVRQPHCPSGCLWLGPGSDCSENRCPLYRGACCRLDGYCVQTFESFCEWDWLGVGSTCDACFAVCFGDSNCDGARDWRDIDYFVAAMNDNVAGWTDMFLPGAPTCRFVNNDVNGDGSVNWRDVDAFVAVMNMTCP